ncbi:hypothetical protein SAMN04488033_11684 [Salegentibacter agarivorans]|uniref:Uncharacterized protein n=1 Tax=Salegentibacter agarivorans TaxID=345907 RepID=A0A1I2MZ87_9FLAO|nr:hypothetical protein [Salegentibacter agarivorans]SFF95939.1 hypothetical protein SAMN04488033_11684 [Salegentibacter agarivorans]
MPIDTYMSGRDFENLLKKVYPPRSVQAHKSLIENALTMEQGKTYSKHLGSTEKQFKEAQKKLIQTLQKLQTKKPYNKAADHFEELEYDVERCNSASCLNGIVQDALKKSSSLDDSGKW